MPEAEERAALEREARTFALMLIGVSPNTYATGQYLRAHEHLPLAPADAFDRRLVAFAVSGPRAARAADAYARVFARHAVLRRKLGVLTAILESSTPHDAAFAPVVSSPLSIVVRLAIAGAGFALALAAGVIVLLPLRIAAAVAREGG